VGNGVDLSPAGVFVGPQSLRENWVLEGHG